MVAVSRCWQLMLTTFCWCWLMGSGSRSSAASAKSGRTSARGDAAEQRRTGSLLDSQLTSGATDRNGDGRRDDMIKAFESSLLNMFGLKERPRPSDNARIPQYMIDIYENHIAGSDEDEPINMHFNLKGVSTSTANTVRSFHHDGKYIHHVFVYIVKMVSWRPFAVVSLRINQVYKNKIQKIFG